MKNIDIKFEGIEKGDGRLNCLFDLPAKDFTLNCGGDTLTLKPKKMVTSFDSGGDTHTITATFLSQLKSD